jgi:hypothetical protein
MASPTIRTSVVGTVQTDEAVISLGITVATGDMLVVGVHQRGVDQAVNSVALDGVALTEVGRAVTTSGTDSAAGIYYLLNPAVGAGTVTVTFAGVQTKSLMFISAVQGAATSNVLDTFTTTPPHNAANCNMTITTGATDTLCFHAATKLVSELTTLNGTQIHEGGIQAGRRFAQYLSGGAPGAVAFTATYATPANAAIIAASFKSPSGGRGIAQARQDPYSPRRRP